jgi:Ca-activated chloride channel family protein
VKKHHSLIKTVLTILFAAGFFPGFAQYYLTGTTLEDSAKPAVHVSMLLQSNKMMYRSGASGDFGIPSQNKVDSVICWADGYDTTRHILYHGRRNLLVLKLSERAKESNSEKGRLANLTQNLIKDSEPYYPSTGETYAVLVENPWVNTEANPSTGFSPNPNKASYANVRRFIQNNMHINPHAVRIEELLNYFSVPAVKPPPPNETFAVKSFITHCPWNPSAKLLHIQAKAKELDFSKSPVANLVFLIDNSGSMDMPNRMPLLKSAFSMLVKSLRDDDRVSIITYGGIAGIWLPPTSGSQKDKILDAIDSLEAAGATAGSSGIQMAYQMATIMPIPNGNNRVILATDGDFNVGITAEKELEEMISRYAKSGVHLTCLGVGMGNFKDSKIETLARYGNGNYAYLDNEQEAEKVLVTELSQNLYNVAYDVTVNMYLNPDMVKQYCLVGYENRKGALYADNSYLMGMEIGSGATINAMVELIPKDSSLFLQPSAPGKPVGSISLLYKLHDEKDIGIQDLKHIINIDVNQLSAPQKEIQFATAVAWFGKVCKAPSHFPIEVFDEILHLATDNHDANNRQQIQFLELVKQARALYMPVPKVDKKKKENRH